MLFYLLLEAADAGAAGWLATVGGEARAWWSPVWPDAVRLEQFDVVVIKRLDLDEVVEWQMKHRKNARSGTSFSSSSGFSVVVGMLLTNASGGGGSG